MDIITLSEEEMYKILAESQDSAKIQSAEDENRFQAEIRSLYERLLDCLSPFGVEGETTMVSLILPCGLTCASVRV